MDIGTKKKKKDGSISLKDNTQKHFCGPKLVPTSFCQCWEYRFSQPSPQLPAMRRKIQMMQQWQESMRKLRKHRVSGSCYVISENKRNWLIINQSKKPIPSNSLKE